MTRSTFLPRSVVIVGASERSAWSEGSFSNFERLGFEGRLYLVNRNGGVVHGQQTFTSCAEIGEPVDLALLLVGAAAIPDALRDLAAAGIRTAVLLAAGMSETGDEGHAIQAEITDLARELDVSCIGPNCLGFINVLDKVPAWSGRMAALKPGGMAVVSQSGATAHTISAFAVEQNIGISHVVSTGNEAMMDTTAAARDLVEDPRVRSIAMFMESVRDPEAFRQLASRAAELRKPLVVLKVGASELAAEIARSHTGALVGDDHLIDAAFKQFGVLRVRTLEQLVVTAGLLSRTGPLEPGGLGVVSMSGGACDLVADLAEETGALLPTLTDKTKARLSEFLPDFAALRNPMDVTGAASADPTLFRDSVIALSDDPGLALVAAIHVLPTAERGESIKNRLRIHAPALSGSRGPVVLLDQTVATFQEETVRNLDELDIPIAATGLAHFVQAAAHATWWSAWLRNWNDVRVQPLDELRLSGTDESWSEIQSLDLLREHGVPTVPYEAVASEQQAVAAAERMGMPVAVKLVSPDIIHKSDIGGVVLGLESSLEVAAAFHRVTSSAAAVPGARLEGALISAMRSGGIELIVGVLRDEQWGLTLVVGFGGVLVHVLSDTAVRPLPVARDDVHTMLSELRGNALLDGVRGGKAVDRERLVSTIVDVARLAERLGGALSSLEINPLRVDADVVEALDASILWV